MADKISFLDALPARRSIYALEPESPISDERIEEITKHIITHCPSPFNVQSARTLILLKGEHGKLWDMADNAAQATFPPNIYEALKSRLAGYKSGYGTVLFFEDASQFLELEKQLGPQRWAGVKDKMPQWSEHSTGMHQFALWTALEAEGLGCNLQHYNPFIDAKVQEQWKVPVDWSLKAQLVFGKPVGPPRERTYLPIEERVLLRKS